MLGPALLLLGSLAAPSPGARLIAESWPGEFLAVNPGPDPCALLFVDPVQPWSSEPYAVPIGSLAAFGYPPDFDPSAMRVDVLAFDGAQVRALENVPFFPGPQRARRTIVYEEELTWEISSFQAEILLDVDGSTSGSWFLIIGPPPPEPPAQGPGCPYQFPNGHWCPEPVWRPTPGNHSLP